MVNFSVRAHPHFSTLSVLCIGLVLTTAAYAQTDMAAVWRATSRLGYGPTPQTVKVASDDPKAWATQQIEAAYTASQSPAKVPEEDARILAPIQAVVLDYQIERKNRRTMSDQTKTLATDPVDIAVAAAVAALGQAAGVVRPDPISEPGKFSREMGQSAASWSLTSCSNPDIENPLLAKMTEFWFNHLNVFVGKGTVRPFVGSYLLSVIRPHALGKFEDLLLASAKHPAMLFYLDQAQSSKRRFNENYARELMELHTLGVNSGYSQNDVRELARILTGWTVPLAQGEGFRFAERLHDKDTKTLLGVSYNNRGVQEGEDAIRFLARQPATAARLSGRLASFFVADKPSEVLVNRLTKTFLSSQGDIRAVMRTLVESQEFWASDNQLFKTPRDFVCSALTAAGGVRDKRDIGQSLGFLSQAGQAVHGWQTPDGYKTDAATWLAPEALTRRADFALGIAGRMPEPVFLLPFLDNAERERIARESTPLRTGLILASPSFMRK